MKFLTNLIVVFIGLIVLFGIAFFGYQFYQKLHAPPASPFKAIPENSALIIKINKPSLFWHNSRNSTNFLHNLVTMPAVASLEHQITFLDSTFQNNRKIKEGIRNNPLFIVLAPSVSNTYTLLFLINLNNDVSEELIHEYIEQTWPSRTRIEKSSYGGSVVFGVSIKNSKHPFYFTIINKLFIASSQAELVKQAIDHLSLNLGAEEDPEFQKVNASSGKNVDANIFIHYPVLAPFVNSLITAGPLSDFLNVASFASWSGLDLIQKRDQFLISGFSVCQDSSAEYLPLFSGQSPQKISMTSIIPDNAIFLSWIGLSDAWLYHRRLVSSRNKTPIYLPIDFYLSSIEQEKQIHFEDYFLPWIGNEIGLITVLDNNANNQKLSYGIINVIDKTNADSCLQGLINMGLQLKPPTNYKAHKIYSLSVPGIIPLVLGNLFNRLEGSYFTFIEDYLICGRDESSLQRFVDGYSSGKTLDKSSTYRNFSTDLSDQVNLYFYCNTSLAFPAIQSALSDEISQEFSAMKDSLQNFESFGIQITNKDEDYFTNLFLSCSQASPRKGPLVWQTSLDNPVMGKPQIFTTGGGGKQVILTVDQANILYLLNTDGAIQWKLKLPGKPCGEIQAITLKNEDSLLLIITSEDKIFLVNKNGLFVFNSPFSIPGKTSVGLLITDRIKPGTESLIVAMNDKSVRAFDLYGKPVSGWQNPVLTGAPARSVQQIQVKGRTYFICSGSDGNVAITNESGKPVIKIKSRVQFSNSSSFFANKTNNKGDFLTTARDGSVVYIGSDGKSSEVKFNNFTPNHLFLYNDVNDDNLQEFIYYDLNKLYCYNKFKKLLYSYAFPPFIERPFLVKLPGGDLQIGAVSAKTREVYLFSKKGAVLLDPEIHGNTPYEICLFNPEPGINLVIGDGRYIKNFILTKY